MILSEEENYCPESSSSSVSAKAGAGYSILSVKLFWCLNASLLDRILEQIKLPWLMSGEREALLGFAFLGFFVFFFPGLDKVILVVEGLVACLRVSD